MSHTFIELYRRFEKYRTDETPENKAQRSYTDTFLRQKGGMTWDELLQHRLVVILGEPGSGKTVELKTQQSRQSSSSFFLELDRLVDEDVISILDEDDNRRFAKWKSGNGEVTFFLDAVDESKIKRSDDFLTALDRVKKAVGPALRRSRFVISSRIWQWRPETDYGAVLQRLGVDPFERKSAKTGRPPTGRDTQQSTETKREEEKEKVPPIIVATLLPLTPAQVEHYANTKGMQNSQEFIAALGQNNAWAFASRPFDVELLYAYWIEKGHLGNLTDLSEYMISKLLAEVPNREQQDALTPALAREGAEFLAAAVIFCRRLKFRVSDVSDAAGENLLSPADVLPETWSAKERHALMDRSLFDAASHGAMSFHHRYHTDYLAAAWIARLMNSNCGVDALEELLFATVDGQRVMRPSLKPVAVWLITEGMEPWRARLAEWMLESCPEIHLVYGDPAALPLEYRRRILSKLVERYQGRNRVMLSLDHAALARFASDGLADEINRYLLDKTTAEDLRADLLMVVCASRKLLACISTALEMFADPVTSDNLRSYVATVIRDIGDADHRRRLALLWPALPEISNTLLARLCEALFPQAIGADGLLTLLRKSGNVPANSINLPYYLEALLRQSLNASGAQELLGGILKLLETPPLLNDPVLSQHFYWIYSLIPVCLQRLLTEQDLSSEAQGLTISSIFVLEQVERHGDPYRTSSNKDNEPSFQQLLSAHGDLRRKLFWERVAKYRQKNSKEPPPYVLGGYGTVVELVLEDIEWLLADAGRDLPLADRRLALEIAADKLWMGRQSLFSSVWKLLRCAKRNSELVALCLQYTWSRLRAPFMGIWFRHFRHKLLEKYWWNNRLRRIKNFRQKIHDKWWLWRHLSDLRKGCYPSTLSYFARLVGGNSSSQYSGSDWSKVTKEWGKAISDAARQGCVVSWRQFSPQLPHEKQERNTVDHRVVIGLVGLQMLWYEGELDFSVLPAEEVDLMVRYACNELNGFPEWFPSLLASRPTDGARALGMAVAGEWGYPASMEHVHDIVAKLAWMPNPVAILAQVVMENLSQSDPLHLQMLEYALAVVTRSGENAPDGLLDIAHARIVTYATEQPQWFSWMKVWLQLDALPALDYLKSVLVESAGKADDLVVSLCATLSGRYDEQLQINNPSYLKPNALLQIIPLVHRHVRVSDDIDRANGRVYSPGARDHAERFRSMLLEILGSSKEPEADDVLRSLLDDSDLGDNRDWILHLLDGRKYLLVDEAPWKPMDVRVFVKEYRTEPRSDYQLFRLVVRLLRDIKNHIECSENAANRLFVRNGDKEEVFRGGLLGKLSELSLDWFNVVQEKEVDLKQRPDLSVERSGLNSLPIEVKLANSWTVKELLIGLENQLVGQYLRSANIRHGIYVLGNTEPKRRWKLSGALIDFAALVSHIQEQAQSLQAQMRVGIDGIEVVGIDLSDPRER